MNRFLELSDEDRALAFEQAGNRRGLPTVSIEKDFWVCLMLRELFDLPGFAEHLTFKGGTSLSKAWGLIDRFSEDIDLTIGREALGFDGDRAPDAARSRKERDRRLRNLRAACGEAVAGRIMPALIDRMGELLRGRSPWAISRDADDPDEQTLLFEFPRARGGAPASYIRPVVKLEFGARSDPWPAAPRTVRSIVSEELPQLFDEPSCRVAALAPERTFWEKTMLLHAETFRPAGRQRRPRMARHYYDLWCLIENGVAERAREVDGLFEQVAEHRRIYFQQNWMDYDTLTRRTLRVVPLPEQQDYWRRDYEAMQSEMFAAPAPDFSRIMETLTRFQTDLNAE